METCESLNRKIEAMYKNGTNETQPGVFARINEKSCQRGERIERAALKALRAIRVLMGAKGSDVSSVLFEAESSLSLALEHDC